MLSDSLALRPARAQVLELPNRNDKIVDFQWEPRGSRFGVLHGEGPRPTFSLYAMKDMRTSAKGVQHLGSQPGKQANCIHWSPQARALWPARAHAHPVDAFNITWCLYANLARFSGASAALCIDEVCPTG